MAAYTSNPITDPDELSFSVDVSFAGSNSEIVIDTQNKEISLKVHGTNNLTTDGATIKAVYSKLKDAWRADAELIKYPFPMGPITDEQFEMVNDWNWNKTNTSGDTQNTVELLRTGGWSVVDLATGTITEQWQGVITLGTLGSTDQVYYQQINPVTQANAASADFKLTGPVNQAVQIYSDPNADGNPVDGYSYLTFFRVFVREWEKLYAASDIAAIGVTTLTFQAYRYPLTNSTDLKITVTQANVNTALDTSGDGVPDTGVYNNIEVTYLRDANNNVYNILGDWANATAYSIGDVVKDTGDNRWYKVLVNHTSDEIGSGDPSANATLYGAYEGEYLIGTTYYPFNIIIDGDTTVNAAASGAANTSEIYTAIQYKLRFDVDIDEDVTGEVYGKTANALLSFVGDTLVTANGVYIESFAADDTNSITFNDGTGSAAQFPFVATLTVNFGTNLQGDQYAKYWVFYADTDGAGNNAYGTTDAILVDDNDNNDMTGSVNPAWPTQRASVTHTFNYDNNTQGGRTANTIANIVAVGIGLSTGQYVSANSAISRTTTNSVTLTAALERNYSQGTTYP